MKCPVDNTPLSISDRQGVEIDYCPTCRGVWLDRGELDKLIERADQYAERRPAQEPRYDERRPEPTEHRYEERRHDYDDDDEHRGHDRGYSDERRSHEGYRDDHRKPHKKESFLGDLFDF